MIAVVGLGAFAMSGYLQSSTLTESDKKLPSNTQQNFSRKSVSINKNDSYLAFTGKAAGIVKHQGEFENFDVKITLDSATPSDLEKAAVEVTIDINSMKTDSGGLTKHLLNPDYFESETYPQALFKSSSIKKTAGGKYDINGQLTIKDITKDVVFKADITNDYAVLKYDMNRLDFNVGVDQTKADNDVPLEVKLIFQ